VVFRAVRELLTNVIKHAQTPAARVSIERSNDRLVIHVEDRGIGFDAEALALDGDRSRFGLFSVREQLRRLGGTLTIDSVEQRGTRVCMELPLQPSGSGALEGAAGAAGGASPAPSAD
jgi:signal transduction histidine kinase